jgi:CTP synthase
VDIAMVGKYVDLQIRTSRSGSPDPRRHPHAHQGEHPLLDSEVIEANGVETLKTWTGARPAASARGIEGKIAAAYRAKTRFPPRASPGHADRRHRDRARPVRLRGANSTEFDAETPHPVIVLITEWQNHDGKVEGAMRSPTWHDAPGRSPRR